MLYSEKLEGKGYIDHVMNRPERLWNTFKNRKESNSVNDLNMDSQIFAVY